MRKALLTAVLLVAAPVAGFSAMPVPQMLHVRHYALDLSFDPAKATVSGTVAMRFTWQTGAGVPTLPVDMMQTLHARTVVLDGKPVTFAHSDDILAVDLPQLAKDSTHTLVIDYSGQPSMHGIHFGTLDGRPVIASYGMPKSAREWWPNLDDPALKANSADIDITVPKGLIAASNGSLAEVKSLPDGRRQFRWHEAAAIYSDVVSVAIGPYVELDDSYTSVTGRRLPLTYYVYADDKATAKSAFSIVPDVLRVYERLFGPYPFQNDKYGIAEFPIPSFREHQTLPSLGRGLIRGTAPVWDLGNVANVIAHDMAHQWFGNSLTLKDWSDVWLNEGFATYAVALWREAHYGKPAYLEFMQSLDTAPFDGPVYIPDDSSPRALLTPTTFNKGMWALHMLRHVMGDKAFFAALRDYVQAHRGGLVDTRSWIAACERAYGKPLDWFFDEWIYGTGLPALRLTWQTRGTPEGRRLELAIDQSQAGLVFTMPVDVAVATPSGSETRVVWLRQRHEQIALPVTSSVKDVVLDPQHWLLRSADRQVNREPSGHAAAEM